MPKTALNAPRGTYFLMDPDDLTLIEDRSNPLYDTRVNEAPDPALVASIRIHGVDKAIKAFKDGNRVVVIDGRRRTVAAREAKRLNLKEGAPAPKVKVELHRGDERSAVARMVLGNFSPKEESLVAKARKAQGLLEQNFPEDEIAILFGVSVSSVRNWLTLVGMAKPVQVAVEKGTARLSDVVRELATLPRDEQPAALLKLESERPTRLARKATGTKVKRKVTPLARLKRIETYAYDDLSRLPVHLVVVIDWIAGDISDETLTHTIPSLAAMFETKAKAAKKQEAAK